jgi:hypothetical protein
MAHRVVDALTKQGWFHEAATKTNAVVLPAQHQSAPMELIDFVSSFRFLRNQSDTMWFLSSENYNEKVADGFSWNEFELMSLSAAEGDSEWTKTIQLFWSQHLPVFMSVHGHYQYVAYCTVGPNNGKYVFGEEPDFEEVSTIGTSIEQAVGWLTSKGLLSETNA